MTGSVPPFEGRDVVCVGFAEWDTELWTNQHHLMARLAASGTRVLFIESLGLRRPTLAGRDVRRILRRLVSGLRPPRQTDGLWVLSPLVLPFHGNALARRLNARILPALVRRAMRRAGIDRPILWGYVPQAELLLDATDPSLVVFHCVDDIAEDPGVDTASYRAAEARFVARADLVLASAPALADRLSELTAAVRYAPNVADTAAFAAALDQGPVDTSLDALPRPRLVFTGAISAKKVDLELLAELARRRPDWTLVLVGPVGLGDPGTSVAALQTLPNVHLLGHRPHGALPGVLRGADVGLIPYRATPLTASIFPMKVPEYLAAGLPVITTPLPALRDVDAVTVAEGAAGFEDAIAAALRDDDPETRRARSRAALGRSWTARLQELEAWVAEASA